MASPIALLCIITALGLLITLAVVDLRTRLLPNVMVAPFATIGIVFHVITEFAYLPVMQVILGGLLGFCSLFAIRAVANYFYKADTLGLGDVKLMGAGGLWLGPDMVMVALMAGSVAALAHGAGYVIWRRVRHKDRISFARLQLPAGPGFAVGLVVAGAWMFRAFFAGLLAGHI